ncbi:MAG: hypothetical protein RLW61_00265 [Gammaproteobacteria bacterium]
MSATTIQWLEHPEHGRLPAQRLVDCLFALTPNGRILHFHVEQVEMAQGTNGIVHLTAAEPLPERSRCQVIPPLVNSFRRAATEART